MKSTMLRFKSDLAFPLLISVIITLLAFYIDEGKYNFKGIMEFGNLFFFRGLCAFVF
jgi:hypothetical protein